MQPVTWQHSLQNSLGVYLPSMLGALAILLLGWIVALAASAGTRKGLAALRTNERLNRHTAGQTNFERIAGRVAFWAVLLLALIGAVGVLRIEGVSGPLSTLATTIMLYLPRLLLAVGLALLALLVASVVRSVVNRALGATRMDEKLSETADMQPLSHTMGNVAYWLVLLLFLPAIVGALQIEGLMTPLSGMTSDFLGMLPNLFAAVVIGLVGWIIAKAVRGLVTNLLAATGVDRIGNRPGDAAEGLRLSQLGGTLAFILIIAWFIGRLVADLVTRLLSNLGFDTLPHRLGLGHAFAAPAPAGTPSLDAGITSPAAESYAPSAGNAAPPPPGAQATGAVTPATRDTGPTSLSQLAGRVALFFIMLFATVEAAALLGFAGVRDLLETFIAFGADILLGLVIFVVGYWLANLAAAAIQRANRDNAEGLARIARVAILGLVIAMGLRAMGIADEIVNLAFGLVFGAVAVAVALAFGLGGREAAGQVAQRWADRFLDKPPRS